MKTKSQPHRCTEDVYKWIEFLQKQPKNEEYQEKIIVHYRKLVDSIARKYSKNGGIHEDMVQVGTIGLLAAVRRYDPTYGKSFESFAIPTIVGEIKRFIRDKTWSVHVPRRVKELGPRIKRTINVLTNELQQSPSIQQIAGHLHVSEEEVLETMEMSKSYKALSADRKIESDADGSSVAIIDLVGRLDAGYASVEKRLLLKRVLSVLSEQEQQVIHCTYFDYLSQKKTGELLGISQMHVSRIQRRALKKLHTEMVSAGMLV